MSAAREDRSLELPPAFWERFVSRYWGREPVVIRAPFGRGALVVDDVLPALAAACDRKREDGSGMLRVFLESVNPRAGVERRYSALQLDPPTQHLPFAADGSLDVYARRMARQFPGKRFGLVLSDVQAYDSRHWRMLRGFLGGLYQRVGVPSGGAQSVLFAGNYRRTPFGIHKDTNHVFTFVLRGPKRMRVWPFERFAGRPETMGAGRDADAHVVPRDRADHERSERGGTVLTGRTGDLIYWPPSYWHRSEPSPGLTASIGLGLTFGAQYLFPSPATEAAIRLKGADVLPGAARAGRLPRSVAESLRANRRAAAAAIGRLSGDPAAAAWLRFATSFGFLQGPPAAPPPSLAPGDLVRVDPSRPVFRIKSAAGEMIVAGAGRTLKVMAAPQLLRLIDELNRGAAVNVGTLERRFAGAVKAGGISYVITRPAIRAFLETLGSWGALERAAPPRGE